MVPVLVLLTVFVLWAGRGGRAALTADLAAEEAATAAALCCEEDMAGEAGREALVEDMLEARPGLGFLCIGGPRPNAGDGSEGFLSEEWVEFEPGRGVGGVGVLGVRFLCESDGAVAPLRGVFPTVTFHGQAAEVVQRESSPSTGFTATRFRVTEALDPEPLVFTVSVHPTLGEVVTLTYKLDLAETTAEPEDFGVSAFEELDEFDLDGTDLVGTVVIAAGEGSAEIVLPLVDDGFYEGEEQMVLELTGADPPGVVLDDDRIRADGVINDNDPQPHLVIAGPDPLEEVEGGRRTSRTLVTAGTLTFQVRLRDETGAIEAPSATAVFVDVRIEDISTAGSADYTPADPAASMWSGGSTRLRFDRGVVAIDVVVQTVDDSEGEDTETFRLVLENEAGAPLGSTAEAVGTIIDDEVRVSVANVSAQEGDASTPGTLQFQVVLDRAPNADLSLRYELVDPDPSLPLDTAQRGRPPVCAPDVDYLNVDPAPATLTITWPHADPLVAVDLPDVTICGDSVVEPDETLWLSMWVPTGGEAVMEHDGGAFGTILNDDTPVVSIVADPPDATGVEGQADPLKFTVGLTVDGRPAQLIEDVTVDYEIGGYGAEAASAPGEPDADYAVSLYAVTLDTPIPAVLSGPTLLGTLVFTPGTPVTPAVTEHVFEAELLADDVPEDPETFRLDLGNLRNPVGAAVFDDTDDDPATDDSFAVGTIEDDPPPVLSVSGFTGPEDSTRSFTVELDMAPRTGETVMVDYAITGGTGAGQATEDVDYEAAPGSALSGPLSFGAGVTARTVAVTLLADYVLDEGDETLRLTLTNPSGAVLSGSDRDNIIDEIDGVGTIEDVDPPVLSVSDFTGPEGTNQSFFVTLANARGEEVRVGYETTGGTGIGEARPPGSEHPDFCVVCNPAVPDDVLSGTLTFPVGTARRSVEVSLLLDAVAEVDETLRLTLRNPDRAALLDRDPVAGVQAYGVGTIVDVDGPYLFVGNTSAREGETLTFTVALCNPIGGQEVTVDYETRAHSTVARLDFEAAADSLTFPAALGTQRVGETQLVGERCGAGVTADAKLRTVQVQTRNDRVEESDEEVHLVLSGQTPAASVGLGKAVGVGRIINVSAATVRVNDPAAVEGEPLGFTISLVDNDGDPAVITEDVTVNYATADRTATAGADYTPVPPAASVPCLPGTAPPGVVTFARNSPVDPSPIRTHSVEVRTCPDTEDEDDETVTLVLRLAAGTAIAIAGLGDSEGTGTIEDADPPEIRIDDVIVQEGNTATFTVTLDDSTSEVVTVLAATEDGTATAGPDYTAASLRLTIPVGATSVPFTVFTRLDEDVEPPETFRVVLSAPSNALLGRAVAVGTINPRCVHININDDENRPPTITVHDAVTFEYVRYVETISLSRPMCDNFSISTQYVSGGILGNASCPEDFGRFYGCGPPPDYTVEADQSENLTISPFTYISELDNVYEGEEWFTTQVRWGASMPSHYHQGQAADWASGRVTIIDADQPPLVRISDASAQEGSTIVFSVAADKRSALASPLQYRTVPNSGTATAGDDYVATDWRDVIASDSFPYFFAVTVNTRDDGVDDGHDTFLVELRGRPGAELHAILIDTVAVGTILEGSLPTLSIDDDTGSEGGTVRFDVELSAPATQITTVDFATVEMRGPAAAEAGVDYQEVSGPLTFGVGQWRQTISVPALTDTDTEYDETFLVELSNPSAGVTLADPSAVGTITGEVHCVDITRPGTVAPTVTVSSPTVRESDRRITFEVSLSEAVCDLNATDGSHTVRVVEDLGGTARPGVDYYLPLTRGVFSSAGGTEVSLSFYLIDDDVDEPDKTLIVNVVPLATGSPIWTVQAVDDAATLGGEAGGVIARGTILDDDDVSLSVAGDSGPEGGFLNFVIRLDAPSDRTVTVDYATEDTSPPSAEAGADYLTRSGTAVIAAGGLSATVAVFAPQDRLDEGDETFLLRLSNPTAGAGLPAADAVATGTIRDDDPPPVVRVSDASVGEGETLVFAVTLDAPSGREVSVPVATRDGSARSADGDYVGLASSVVVFAPGMTRQTVSVQTRADDVVESAEIVWLDLGPVGDGTATIGDDTGRGVIRDTSDRRVSVSDASVLEGGTLAFEVGFAEGPSGRDVTVRYRTRAGTAAAGDDYDDGFEAASRELRIVAGDTSATVSVPTVPDTLNEDNESLELVLSDPAGAVIVAGSASGTIINDDPLPELRVSNTEASEGVGASAVFTLSLGEASGRDVTVAYSTADLTADAGDDYIAVSDGEVVIDSGDRQATVDVALVDDDVAEEVETFRLVVSSAVNASRGDSVGVATVTDDDGLVQILVDDPAAVYEGDGASAVFTVRLSRAHTEPVSVFYSTADGTATAGSDYTAATSELLVFWVGVTSETVTVPLINDDDIEQAETFRLVLTLSTIPNAELGDGEATVLIRDDDGLPTVSVTDAATRTEGSTASFTVTLSRAVPQEVTVDYATRTDLTAAAETAAVPGQDYTAASGTVTFAARATEATVTVPLLGDALDEHTETFWLRLASPVGATIADGTATGTIDDDDPLPEITIADAAATEGAPVSFEVRLTPFSGRTVTVPWTTEARPPGAGAASPGSDYTAASGTLTFAPGTTTARVEVATLPDDVSEADETFLVQLGTPANAALDDSTASGVIFDDDGLPRVFIADTTVNEDDGPAIFTVTLSHPSSQPVTVEYNTADGTAEDPDDYAPDLVRTLTIPATFTGGEISVFVADDDLTEGTETFTITLTDPVNAVIAEGAGTAVGYIVDDEGQPRLTVADAAACECAVDGTLDFHVTLSHASTEVTSVRYTTFDGDATSPGDYIATSATLTIPAGEVVASIPVVLVDDGVAETVAETFRLRLDNPVGVELATEEAIGTIFDNESLPSVSTQSFDAFSNENDGFAYHRVTLSHPSDLTVTVNYSFDYVVDRSGLATVDSDPGTLTFAPGVLEQRIAVPLTDNDVATYGTGGWSYANALYQIQLVSWVNARILFRYGYGVVWDDETPPYVDSVTGHDILEGAGAATFTITLNRLSDTAVTATYRTADGTAAAGSDYSAAEATVTFRPGTITAAVTVPITDDTEVEDDESFTLEIIDDPRNSNLLFLADPSVQGRSRGNSTVAGTVLIIDDDTLPEISVTDTAANEDAGTMTFWVSLSRASATDVTVGYATADGTATAGSDYTATNDTLTILAGDTGAPVSVTIIDDTDDTESDETFTLNLSGATGATITATSATATIIEDSNLPIISVLDSSSSENRTFGNRMGFDVVSDRPVTQDIQVDYQMVEVPSLGDEAATVGADFPEDDASGTLDIPPGRVHSRIGLLLTNDAIPERDERFLLILSNPRGALLGDSRAWGTILNDDVPIVSVADVEVSESDGAVVFTVQLHEPGVDAASLDYTTVVRPSEGDRAASPGEDYTTASGTLNIPAGDTTATISVPIIADTADEADETFLLVLTNPDTLEFRDSTAVGTIVDDDPGFWIEDDRSVWENAGSMVFTVQRDHTSTDDVAVDYRFGSGGSAVGGADCAVDGVDFEWPSGTSASGTVTMPAAGRAAAVSVEICDDDDAEGRESLLIELTNVTGRKTTGVGTIIDDDRTDLPRIDIGNSPSRTETLHDALSGARFQISADGPLTDTVTVTWRTENCPATDTQCPHPATAGDDYTANSGTVTLTPTNPSATVTVTVLNDTTDEDDEQFFVRITGVTGPAAVGSGVTHAEPVGIGFITDDDLALPRINISNSAIRGERLHVASGGARFQIGADGPLTGTVTVAWSTEDCPATDTNCSNPATAGDDYSARSGTVTLTPDDRSAFVTVTVRDDTIDEPSEAFYVRITAVTGPAAVGSGATHTDPVGIGFIIDDD